MLPAPVNSGVERQNPLRQRTDRGSKFVAMQQGERHVESR